MAKTQEELNVLKNEFESLSKKLAELSEDELEQVTGGVDFIISKDDPHYVPERYFDTDPKNKTFE